MQLTQLRMSRAGLSGFQRNETPLTRRFQHDPVVLVRHVENGLSGRDLRGNEDPDATCVEDLVPRFGLLGEAGSDLLAPHPASERDADPDARRIHPPRFERAPQHGHGTGCHDDRHAGDAIRGRGVDFSVVPKAEIEKPVLTQTAFDRLQAEYDHLTTTGRTEVAARLLRARELGDLSENAEYHATKDEQGLMEARIRQLNWTLKNASITQAPTQGDTAGPGMLVTVREPGTSDDADTYLLAASPEERAKGARTITPKSPFGSALMGKRPGDQVVYEAPGGNFTYEIMSVQPWDGS
jgi:transcription elongation factor GreA